MNLIKKYLLLFLEHISQVRYEIGFPILNINDFLSEGTLGETFFLKHCYRDRWFADPFILEVDNNSITLLVEEFFYSTQKGRIARLTVSRSNYHLISNELVLELDSHLSFPFIYRENGHVFICPESSCSSTWKEYEYDVENNQIINERIIINEALTDAIIDDKGRILTTKVPDTNSSFLTVYTKNGGDSYKELTRISFNEKIARNAGAIFKVGNRFFRPAQECNFAYGHAVVIQEITDYDLLSFMECCRIVSPHKILKDGCHTFNTFRGVFVIDVNGPRYPRLRKLASNCYSIYRKLSLVK